MSKIHYETPANGLVIYKNPATKKSVSAWAEDLQAVGAVGQSKAAGRLAKGKFAVSILVEVLRDLERQRDAINPDTLVDDEEAQDDYIDLLTAIDDLRGLLRRIRTIT